CGCEGLLDLFGRYHDHAVFVTDDPIPRMNYLAAALHRAAYLSQRFRACPRSAPQLRKHGKRAAPDGGRIPDGAVNHHASQTLAIQWWSVLPTAPYSIRPGRRLPGSVPEDTV